MNKKTLAIILFIGALVLVSLAHFTVDKEFDEWQEPEYDILISMRTASYLEGYQQALSDADSLELFEWEDYDQAITIGRLSQHRERLERREQ